MSANSLPPSTSPDPIEYQWNVLNSINEWIRFSDTKAGAIVVLNGTLLTVAFTNPTLLSGLQVNVLISILLLLATMTMFTSTIYALRAVTPRLNVGEPESLIFFAHLALLYKKPDPYRERIKLKLNDADEALDQLSSQIWANSHVAWRKYQGVVRAMECFIVTLVILAAIFIIVVF